MTETERIKAEAAMEVLIDLEGTTVEREDPDGYAGTFMRVLFGGDTGNAADWQLAWEWSDKFTQKVAQ